VRDVPGAEVKSRHSVQVRGRPRRSVAPSPAGVVLAAVHCSFRPSRFAALEWPRQAHGRCPGRQRIAARAGRHVLTGEDELFVVPGDGRREPVRLGLGAEDEEGDTRTVLVRPERRPAARVPSASRRRGRRRHVCAAERQCPWCFRSSSPGCPTWWRVSPVPLTISVTWAASWARWTAARPAELPAPTTKTCSPAMAGAQFRPEGRPSEERLQDAGLSRRCGPRAGAPGTWPGTTAPSSDRQLDRAPRRP
jgi:hypothetical protein